MLADLRLALRRLAAAPLVALVAVLSLALGIGATVAAFSFVEGTALRPFPLVPRPERVVRVGTAPRGQGFGSSSYPAFVAYRGGVPALADAAAYQLYAFGMQPRAGAPALETWGVFASAGYFRVLGVRPALGRFFDDADDRVGAAAVAVLSHALWRERFAADPSVLGRRVRLNGHDATVVGVAPPAFAGAEMLFRADVIVPLGTYPVLGDYPTKLADVYSRWLSVIGRLRDGSSPADAAAQLAVVGRRLAAARTLEPGARPALRAFDGGEGADVVPAAFAILLGAAAVVLLVVCTNVAALFLVRGLERARDAGVRAAVGAGRLRLAREALAESALVAAAGSVIGMGLAAAGTRALMALIPDVGLPVTLRAPLDGRALAAAVVFGVASAVAAGLAPALRASRADPVVLLRTGGRGIAARRPRTVGALVGAQVAFATVALVCAALFARTYNRLQHADTGLTAPERVLVTRTDFGYVGRRNGAAQREGVRRVLERLRALPGVRAAAAADFVPLGRSGYDTWTVRIAGYAPAPGESMDVPTNRITPEYFAAVGTPILRGRGFTVADDSSAPRVVIVSEAFARRYWPGRDAVGRTVQFYANPATVVGVARDADYRDEDFARAPIPFVYQPYAQGPVSGVGFLVRSEGAPVALAPALRRAVAEVDPGLPLSAPVTLAEWSAGATLLPRLMSQVLGGLGACALALAAVGVFGVVAYAATQRRREVGVRLALGATEGNVVLPFVVDGVRLAAFGLAAGSLVAVAAARLVAGQLYGVSPADPVAFGGAALVMLAAALAASWLPARRAARVDPVEALRGE